LHQVSDLFELNVKLRCQKVKYPDRYALALCTMQIFISY